jgi:hypothetical protein
MRRCGSRCWASHRASKTNAAGYGRHEKRALVVNCETNALSISEHDSDRYKKEDEQVVRGISA